MDATAFRRDLNGNAGQLENQILPKEWRPRQEQQALGDVRRSPLEKGFDRRQRKRRDWQYKDQKRKRKDERANNPQAKVEEAKTTE